MLLSSRLTYSQHVVVFTHYTTVCNYQRTAGASTRPAKSCVKTGVPAEARTFKLRFSPPSPRLWRTAFGSPLRCEQRLVGAGGFEPPTLRLSSACSNQLSYAPTLVEPTRIELVTSCLQSRRSPS